MIRRQVRDWFLECFLAILVNKDEKLAQNYPRRLKIAKLIRYL